jgi:hypothetical protein
MSFPIPPNCSSYREALKRASDKWGTNDALGHFKGLLVGRGLRAYASHRSGRLAEYPPDTWADFRNDYLLNDDRYPGRTRNSITVFLTSELDEVLPVIEQQAEPHIASALKASANSEQLQKGRPTKAGADEFWIEAARLVHEGKQGCAGKTQRNLIDAMIKWASANMPAPYSDDTVEIKIKQFWRALKLGGRN